MRFDGSAIKSKENEMKLFNDQDMIQKNVGNFGFSGVRPEKLGATEYTLVSVITDKTGSVAGFEAQLVEMKKTIVEACKKDPRAEFLMMRNVWFNTSVDEEHGFIELNNVDATQFIEPRCYGSTSLYDAVYSSVAVSNEYAKTLTDKEFGVNAVVFVITDGGDNNSSHTVADIKAELARGVQQEYLESINVILVGINAAQCLTQLEALKNDAGLTQFIDAGDATSQNLAKLANFVSKSISSQSQALGTGGPSQALTF
jgi:uncharacterized protein YegL